MHSWAFIREGRDSMAKQREPVGRTPQTNLRGKEPGPREGRAIPIQDQEALLEEISRARAEEALRARVGRNEPCPCGSGKKYKRCCLDTHRELLSRVSSRQSSVLKSLERQTASAQERVKEGYELLGQRQFEKARSLARKWGTRFPRDDRFRDISVTASIHLGEPRHALELAKEGYEEALAEKEYFLAKGHHSWEDSEGEQGVGHAYAPEAWLERLWVARRALAYQEAYPKEPDPYLAGLAEELQGADDPHRYPQGREEGLKVRKEALAHVLEELKKIGPRALPYVLPLCPRYGWSGFLVPEILAHWADPDSIRALVEMSMFRYPYLSESCLRALEQLGERSLPYLREAFEKDQEMDPIKTGLLSVAGEIGSPEAMDWLTQMLEHPLPAIVNWAAGILGRKRHGPALPKLKKAMERVGQQPYIMWALEELEEATKN
jgi:hypothetical protein